MTNDEIADQLHQEAVVLCQRAVRILNYFCWNIVQSNITLAELKEVIRLNERSVVNSMQQFYKIEFKEVVLPEWKNFITSLRSRFKECQKYEQRHKQLFRLAGYCHDLAPGELGIIT